MPNTRDSANQTHLRLVQSADAPPDRELDPTETAILTWGSADLELEWFFTMAESDMGLRSNFVALLSGVERSLEDRAESVHAHRIIRRRLERVGDPDAGVLLTAYAARPWPLLLREELGRVTGVVVRLASAEGGLPDDDKELDWLERRTADRLNEALQSEGRWGIQRFRAQATTLLLGAFQSYVAARGGADVRVLPGVT